MRHDTWSSSVLFRSSSSTPFSIPIPLKFIPIRWPIRERTDIQRFTARLVSVSSLSDTFCRSFCKPFAQKHARICVYKIETGTGGIATRRSGRVLEHVRVIYNHYQFVKMDSDPNPTLRYLSILTFDTCLTYRVLMAPLNPVYDGFVYNDPDSMLYFTRR